MGLLLIGQGITERRCVEQERQRLYEQARQIIRATVQALPSHPHVSADVSASPVRVTPEQANDLALVINELIANTVMHGLGPRPAAHVVVGIGLEKQGDGQVVRFEFRDDGSGYPPDVLRMERHNVGL